MPFVRLPHIDMHYEHCGAEQAKTTLLLIHGNFASWRWWQPLLQHLPARYRAYAPELRGCGDTSRPDTGYNIEQLASDIYEFTQALNLPAVHVVGHSLGGAVAMQFALNYPQKVRTLTLVAPAPAEGMAHLKSKFPHLRLTESSDFHHVMQTLNLNRVSLQKALSRMMPSIKPNQDSFVTLLDDAAHMSPEAIVGFYDALTTWSVQDELGKLNLPVLVLWGSQDSIVEKATLERTVEALPQAQFVVWDNVGHAPQLEQPEAFQQLLLEFIENHQVKRIYTAFQNQKDYWARKLKKFW
ncbi:alpha/beta hydrolase [Candidatus Albibeggiatoa sp. nov. NOAA]|uniref:alpha/beta fold hydrolase n=1 Tax=Candidatus Albibeggiatoa sp. nov. NOAA TaxID=3162724 RepID=UPI0032F9B851|nr:alpha/beta hydrolase [Thiotrichaceae bacterium]